MTHAFEPATPSRDANALLALTVVLIATTWSFFGRFSVVAAAVGIATGMWLHWWYLRHPGSAPASGRRPQMLNIALVCAGVIRAGRALFGRRHRMASDAPRLVRAHHVAAPAVSGRTD